MAQQENFQTLRAKAAVAERKGDAAAASDLRAKSMTVATEADINNYGYQLLGSGKIEEAIAAFRDNIKRHPDSWNTYDSLGEGLAVKGAKAEAAENYRKALEMTKDQKQKDRITGDTFEALELDACGRLACQRGQRLRHTTPASTESRASADSQRYRGYSSRTT